MNVSIIIPNWNGRQLLAKNLPIVIEAREKKRNKISEIIVVDDKSTDDSVVFLENNFRDSVKIVRHRENRGFSSAVNTGVRSSTSPLVCLLNTDVIPSSDFLASALVHFKMQDIFAVSLHEAGFGWARAKFEKGFIIHEPGDEAKSFKRTFWASGGSAVFRRDTWISLKGFDEELFSPFYWEDVDLSYRAMKRGYRILWEPEAHVIHKHESVININNFSRRKLDIIKERNQLLLIWKNITSRTLFRKHIEGLISRIIKSPGYVIVVAAALSKIKILLRLRKREIRESRVSDEAIFASFQVR